MLINPLFAHRRSASDLEDKGLITKSQKGLIKDLIISADPILQAALDDYEKGNTAELESMIREGRLDHKSSVDLLEDLDLDFLSVSMGSSSQAKPGVHIAKLAGAGNHGASSPRGGGNAGVGTVTPSDNGDGGRGMEEHAMGRNGKGGFEDYGDPLFAGGGKGGGREKGDEGGGEQC